MGAVAKSMSHPYNNLGLTFGDLNNMMLALSTGKLTCTEKFDGTNMHWYIADDGFPRFARNFSDVRAGGVPLIEMCARLSQMPFDVSQFVNGMKTIHRMKDVLNWTLRTDGTYWVNCEIIDKDNPQCFKYDTSHIVFHKLVTPNEKKTGTIPVVGSQRQAFVSMVKNVMDHGDFEGWTVLPPTQIMLEPKETNPDIAECFNTLTSLMESEGCTLTNTLSDFIRSKTITSGEMMGMNPDDCNRLADLCLSLPRAPRIQYLRGVSKSAAAVDEIALSKNRRKWINNCLRKIMEMWTRFGAHILDGVGSCIISEPQKCQERLEKMIEWNIVQLGDVHIAEHRDLYWEAMDYLTRFEELHVDPPAIEGLVYDWKGDTYKVTGAFPSVNRVCGALRYRLNMRFPEGEDVCE